MHTTNVFTPVANIDRVFVFEDCCNVYLIKQEDRCILIDLGSGAVLEHLDQVGIKTVDAVYFTHAHRDQLQGISRVLEAEIPVRFPVDARHYIEREQRQDLNNIIQFLRSYPGNRFDMPRPFSGALFDIQPNSRIPCGDFDLEVVPIPGHLNHQVAYLVDLCDERIAFCGDAMYSASKVHEPFNLETDHYTGIGARLAAESLRILKQLRPSIICPSHGPVTSDNAWSAFEKTINRLHELSELKDTICPGIPHVKRLVPQRGNTLMPVSEHLFIWNNSYFLLSDEGAVLMVDNAGPLPESFWEQYELLIGDRKIEVVLVSHIHCDHVEGIEALRAKQPLEVWVHESIADAIKEPHRFRRPYLPAKGTRVDTRLKTNETYKWREYDFSSYWFPAQTDLRVLPVPGLSVLAIRERGALETTVRLHNPRIILFSQNRHELASKLSSHLFVCWILYYIVKVVRVLAQVVEFLGRELPKAHLEQLTNLLFCAMVYHPGLGRAGIHIGIGNHCVVA